MYVPHPGARKFDWSAAAADYEADLDVTIVSLARRYGVSERAMGNALWRSGVRRGADRPGNGGIVPVAEFIELHGRFRTNGELARHLGVCEQSVTKRARRYGLRRPIGRPPKTPRVAATNRR